MSDTDSSLKALGLPTSKEELLGRIQAAWRDLEGVVATLPGPALTKPGQGGWSVKDHLAHIAAWEQFMLGHYVTFREPHRLWGLDEAMWRGMDDDGINGVIYERNRDLSITEALEQFRRSHAQVVEVLQALAWENMTALYPGDQQGRPVLAWVAGNTYEHYEEHRDMIIEMQTPSLLGD